MGRHDGQASRRILIEMDLQGCLSSLPDRSANSSFISSKVSRLLTLWEPLLILNKFGRAFIENPHDSRDFQFCDTPSPPVRGLKMLPRPDRPGSIRYRTVDLLNTTGLNFFFLRGFIMAVHSHTANAPVAAPTIQHFS